MFQPVNPKQSFPDLEHEVLDFWEQNHIFERSVAQRKGRKKYVFFDGPPFANGLPHYGHILANALKDAVTRYWTMKGYYVPRQNGWDCHGLPVEYEIEKELKLTGRKQIEDLGVEKFNGACRESVFRYTAEWEKLLKRLGRWVDMEHSYATLDNNYMESIWWVFKQIWSRKLMYKGFKPMHICPRCETPLSNFEVTQGYKDVTDLSVTVTFPLKEGAYEGCEMLAWTTTPLTLPGNMFLAVNPELEYVVVRSADKKFILAKARVEAAFGDRPYEIEESVDLQRLVGAHYEPLFNYFVQSKEDIYRVVMADFVTVDDGVGIVHIAPAYGEDDMYVGVREKVTMIQHVKMDGMFVSEVSDFAGKFAKGQDVNVKNFLDERGRVFSHANIRHSYPHCWRCDTPLLNFVTNSWFIRVTEVKEHLLRNNKKIHWQPGHIEEGRFGKWLEGARDWAVSRNRFWGCPLPIWECACGETVCIESIRELSELSHGGVPMREGELDLHKPYIDEIMMPCKKCGNLMRRVPDVLDCWFESGSMPYAQLHYPFENKKEFEDNFPADFIAEGLDQTRGWFYTLHVISTILFNKPAFGNVIVNGILLASDGEKLSKRKKNYPDPNTLFETRGVDSMRMFLYTSPATLADDVRFSEKHVDEVVKSFTLTIWNVYSFFMTYASIDGWKPEFFGKELHKFRPEHVLDQWIISELQVLIQNTTVAMDSYNLMDATRPMVAFADDLSNWYVRRSRRRFWKSESDKDKRSAYQTLYFVLFRLSQLIAPFMPFLAESMFLGLSRGLPEMSESVHLTDWPDSVSRLLKPLLNEEMHIVRQIVNLGHSARAAAFVKVRQPLAGATIACPDEVSQEVIEKYLDVILEELNVKKLEFVKELTGRVTVRYTPRSKVLGPKFGSDVQAIIRMVKAGDVVSLRDGTYQVGDFTLTHEDLEVGYEGKEGTGVASQNGYTLILDTVITDELLDEGIARDVVRFVQELRKEAHYEVSDRILLAVETPDPKVRAAVTSFADYIRRETLAQELQQSGSFDADIRKNVDFDGVTISLALAKAAT